MSDTSRHEMSSMSIRVGGQELATSYAVITQCSFNSVAGAQPGTATIVCRDPLHQLNFRGGLAVEWDIDGVRVWGGIVMQVEMSDWTPAGDGEAPGARKTRRWVLGCVDWNILFDKLVIYNHTNPALMAHNNRPFTGDATDRGVLVDTMRNDTDISFWGVNYQTKVVETGYYSPTRKRTLGPNPGSYLRGLFEMVSISVDPGHPGALVWYIDPRKYVVYMPQDAADAPFSVADGAGGEVSCHDLTISTDISSTRNDVFIFANELNPDPSVKVKPHVKYAHKYNQTAMNTYGRFQYSEVAPHYSQPWLDAHASKILSQQGTPAERTEFTIHRPGLYPGQIVTVSSDSFGYSKNLPVRSVQVGFLTKQIAEFRVTCSFDTMDPWGLLSALRRPTNRGLVQPRFQSITGDDEADPISIQPFTYLCQTPKSLGGGVYQAKYPFIRNSTHLTMGGKMQRINGEYTETDPDTGKIKLLVSASGPLWLCYHTQEV